MEKKDVMVRGRIETATTEEIQLWSVTNTTLKHMVGYCASYAYKAKFENLCLSDEQKAKLDEQGMKYHQKAYSLSDDIAENNRILDKYCPLIKEERVTLEFLLNDEI